MTVQDAITKLRVMLGAEEPVQEVKNEEATEETKVAMASAELVDGSIVETEGELAPGAILYVQVEEGEAPFAPEGQHETVDGLIISVGENGEILSIEEKEAAAEPVAEEAGEEKEEVEMTEEVTEEEVAEEVTETFNAEELLSGVAEIIKPYAEKIETLTNELNVLTERFEAVADAPAAAPVKKNFMEDARAAKQVAEARLQKLAQIRRNK